MSSDDGTQHPGITEKSGRKFPILFGALLIILIAWSFGYYYGRIGLVDLASSVIAWARFNLSTLRITLIVGFGGSLLSIPFLRRRNRKAEGQASTNIPLALPQQRVHPLLLTPRPSRDSQFVIRKTKKRGRIARNRSGERLPLTQRE